MTLRALVRGAYLALALLVSVPALATGILPLSGAMQFDKDASPPAYLNGGQLYVYQSGTTTPAAIYSDFLLTTPLSVPITLNAAGRVPPIYGADGSVRLRLLSSTGVLQFDDDHVALVTAVVSTTPIVVTPQQLWATGDVKTRYDDQPADGFVRANGRTIGSATSGASERANADCEDLFKHLWGFANISLPSGKGATAAADWSANKTLTLPDVAGRLIGALDDLGAGAKSRITSATVTGPTVAGASGGAQTVTLDTTMIPSHAHASPAVIDPGHTHGVSTGALYTFGGATAGVTTGTGFFLSPASVSSASTGISLAANTGNAGGGAAHANMPPVMLFTVYLKL